jgi:hypothetical protein
MVPTVQMSPMTLVYLALSCRVYRCAMTTYVKIIKPPAPMPCTQRPETRVAAFWAKAQTKDPAVKKVSASRMAGLWPKDVMFAKMGWKTAEQRTNAVPAQ